MLDRRVPFPRLSSARRAVAIASTEHAGLFSVFSVEADRPRIWPSCAASSVLAAFIALFVGWLSYLVADTKRSAPRAVCTFLTGRDTYEMEDELWVTLN